jgi:hypothetical protein
MHMYVVSLIKASSMKCFQKTRSRWTHQALRAMMDVAKMLVNKDNIRLTTWMISTALERVLTVLPSHSALTSMAFNTMSVR